jgi:hypothetical protein
VFKADCPRTAIFLLLLGAVVASDVSLHGRLADRTSGITRKKLHTNHVDPGSGSSSCEEGVLGCCCLQVLYFTSLDLFSSHRFACAGTHGFRNRPPFHPSSACPGSDKAATHSLQSDVLCSRLPESLRTRPGQAASNQPSQPYVVRSCPLFASALPASACPFVGYFSPSRGAPNSPIHHRSLLVCHPHFG